MTFGHQAAITIGSVTVPWGIAVSLLGVTSFLVGVRLVSSDRRAVVWSAAGVVLAVLVLSLPGPGGSVIIPNGVLGMTWAFAPTAIALMVALWPAPRTEQTTRPL